VRTSGLGAADWPQTGPARPLPLISAENRAFWTCGVDGRLCLQRCTECGFYLHPPGPICRRCGARALTCELAPGSGVVRAVTVNHHPWLAALPPPYAVIIVELAVQEGLSFLSNAVGCDPEDVHEGMRVEVVYERVGEFAIPLFRPVHNA
jgi:uncharacterized OB-fold protein